MEEKDDLEKPFLTYEQQIDKLSSEKGLEITDEKYAIQLLKHFSYFDLISGYKQMFKNKNGRYKLHTSIDDIYSLYCFDDKLRTIFLKYILKIEKHIKSLISYSFCYKNGEEQQQYLNATKYNYNEKNQDAINDLISRLGKIITSPQNYSYVKHQKNKYGNVPLWVIMKALSLGTVSKRYSFLPQELQCCVSIEFQYVNEGMMVQMLDLLARVRNVCAHNERLYDYRYKKGTIDDTDVHRILALPKKKGYYKRGKNDLFAVIIVLKYLLSENDFISLIDSLIKAMEELFRKTKCIQRNQLYKYMGFPDDWERIKTIEKIISS